MRIKNEADELGLKKYYKLSGKRKTKLNMEHGTCDKKTLTNPCIRICPIFNELKEGDFLYPHPPCMDQCLSQQFFFLNASVTQKNISKLQ